MWLIEESEAVSVEQVKSRSTNTPNCAGNWSRNTANLPTCSPRAISASPCPHDLWRLAVDFVMGRALGCTAGNPAVVQQAIELAARERFFHWELEFPELFFDRYGRPLGEEGGFEAVIGNPPYVRQEQLAAYKPYFQDISILPWRGRPLPVFLRARAGRAEATVGAWPTSPAALSPAPISPAPSASGCPLWRRLETIIDFGENQPFPGAEMVRPSIVVLRKQAMMEGFRSLFIAEKIPVSLEMALDEQGVDCEQSRWRNWNGRSSRRASYVLIHRKL